MFIDYAELEKMLTNGENLQEFPRESQEKPGLFRQAMLDEVDRDKLTLDFGYDIHPSDVLVPSDAVINSVKCDSIVIDQTDLKITVEGERCEVDGYVTVRGLVYAGYYEEEYEEEGDLAYATEESFEDIAGQGGYSEYEESVMESRSEVRKVRFCCKEIREPFCFHAEFEGGRLERIELETL